MKRYAWPQASQRILDIGFEHDEANTSPRDAWLRTGHFFALLAGTIGTVRWSASMSACRRSCSAI